VSRIKIPFFKGFIHLLRNLAGFSDATPAADGTPSGEILILHQHHSVQLHRSHQPHSQPIEIQSVQENHFLTPVKSQRQTSHRLNHSGNRREYLGEGSDREQDNILTLAHKLLTVGFRQDLRAFFAISLIRSKRLG
jgi:hypothetical protein